MSRTGKIARLPAPIREEINQRLHHGVPGAEVAAWLNSLPEVRVTLAQRFDERPITISNISDWRLGGYKDWAIQQAVMAEARQFVNRGGLAEVGGKAWLVDNLEMWVVARLMVTTHRVLKSGDEEARWKFLRELAREVMALRRSDLKGQRLRFREKRLNFLRLKNAHKWRRTKLRESQ